MPLEPETPLTASRTLPDRRRRIAPLAASLLIIALIVGVAAVVRIAVNSGPGSGSGGEPPVLQLTMPAGAVAPDAVDSEASHPRYVVYGALPGGRPDPAPVYRFGAEQAPADLVRRLAKALGVQGDPVRTQNGWRVGTEPRVLTVRHGGDWAWSLGHNNIVADSPVQCFRAPCPYETPNSHRTIRSHPAPPDPAVVARVAKDVLTALDLSTANVTTTSSFPTTLVRAPRTVDGKPTDGFSTALSIGVNGKIIAGKGWLGQPADPGPSYPLITAADALNRLQAQPYAEILLCRPQTGGGCAPTPQLHIVGARLGLVLATDAVRPVLVPAWLFQVAGQVDPVTVVAVQSRYLRTPTDPKPTDSPNEDPAGGGGTQPQSAPPAAPSSGPHPASPKPG